MPAPRPSPSPRLPPWLAPVLLALLVAAAWANSLGVPFLFDDGPAVVDNPSLRDLERLGDVLFPQIDGGITSGGRPLVNLSLALNYAVTAESPAGYHVGNAILHWFAAWSLFGLVRRLWPTGRVSGDSAALAVAAIWAVHPLQTAAVTYIVQRAEVLMALCYLLTLLGVVRAAREPNSLRWPVFAVLCCLAGMSAKEVMVSAPLVALVMDRTFLAGSFAGAWRARRWLYVGLAATWVPLVLLVNGTAGRGGTAGLASPVGSWDYLMTQCWALVHYLRLVLWPTPLVFDYGITTVSGLSAVWLQGVLLLAALAGSGYALWRSSVMGFLGLTFFAILAPSSSFVPVASQTIAEHRMYLPLALLVSVVVWATARWLGGRAAVVWVLAAAAGLAGTVVRNRDYASAESIWADTVAKRPGNARAHHNLGLAKLVLGRTEEAMAHFRDSIALAPRFPEPHFNLGLALSRMGRSAEALEALQRARDLRPDHAPTRASLGAALLAAGRTAEAEQEARAAVRLDADSGEARNNLGLVLLETGRATEALAEFAEAMRLRPDLTEAPLNAGNACAALGRFVEAEKHYREALGLRPNQAMARNNLGNVLLELDRPAEALGQYQEALGLNPELADARRNLGLLLEHFGRMAEARPHLEWFARRFPGDPQVAEALARVRGGSRP